MTTGNSSISPSMKIEVIKKEPNEVDKALEYLSKAIQTCNEHVDTLRNRLDPVILSSNGQNNPARDDRENNCLLVNTLYASYDRIWELTQKLDYILENMQL